MSSQRSDVGPTVLDVFLSESPIDVVGPGSSPDKSRKKELKRSYDPNRQLDSWERYRALNDAMDEAYEVIGISNREARFALLVMGILNAFVVVAASQTDLVSSLDGTQRIGTAVLLGIYALAAVYFLFQAIEVLHPGRFRPRTGDWGVDSEDFPKGVRYYEDVLQRDVHSHWQAWREIQIGQLSAELAMQLHSLCFKANVKRVALSRLFVGLRVMTLLVVGLMVLFLSAAWI